MNKLVLVSLVTILCATIVSCTKSNNSPVVVLNEAEVSGTPSNGAAFDISDISKMTMYQTTYKDSMNDSVTKARYQLSVVLNNDPAKALTFYLHGKLKAQTYNLWSKNASVMYQIGNGANDLYKTDSGKIVGSITLTTYSYDTLIGTFSTIVTNPIGNNISIPDGRFKFIFNH